MKKWVIRDFWKKLGISLVVLFFIYFFILDTYVNRKYSEQLATCLEGCERMPTVSCECSQLPLLADTIIYLLGNIIELLAFVIIIFGLVTIVDRMILRRVSEIDKN